MPENSDSANERDIATGDYEYRSEPVEWAMVAEARLKAEAAAKGNENLPALRSCWRCNSAHVHFLDPRETWFFSCFDCGRWWFLEAGVPGAIDVTIYDPETADA
jgi:hypothetical protein